MPLNFGERLSDAICLEDVDFRLHTLPQAEIIGADLKPATGPLIEINIHGKARSDKAFSSWFAGAAAAAGIEGKSAHGLRKSRAMALAEAGATAHQIAAWTGHESLSEVQRYSKSADRKRILSGADEEQKLETVSETGLETAVSRNVNKAL